MLPDTIFKLFSNIKTSLGVAVHATALFQEVLSSDDPVGSDVDLAFL
jgi:hypothetical protein